MQRSKTLPGKINIERGHQSLDPQEPKRGPAGPTAGLALLLLDFQPQAPLARTRLALSNHFRCARMDRMVTAQDDRYPVPRLVAHLGLELSQVDDVAVVRDLTTDAA